VEKNNFGVKLLFLLLRLTRITTLLLAASRKANRNKASSLQTLCPPQDYLDLTHTDELVASPQT